jgi:hypothetical protein
MEATKIFCAPFKPGTCPPHSDASVVFAELDIPLNLRPISSIRVGLIHDFLADENDGPVIAAAGDVNASSFFIKDLIQVGG